MVEVVDVMECACVCVKERDGVDGGSGRCDGVCVCV